MKTPPIPHIMWGAMRVTASSPVHNSLDTARVRAAKPRGRHPDKRLTAVSVRNIKTAGRHGDGNGLYLIVDKASWILVVPFILVVALVAQVRIPRFLSR